MDAFLESCNTAMDFTGFTSEVLTRSTLVLKLVMSMITFSLTIGAATAFVLKPSTTKKLESHPQHHHLPESPLPSADDDSSFTFVGNDTLSDFISITSPPLLSRFLYPNPVSLLVTSVSKSKPISNAMVISWLTPIDNSGRFVFAINKKRFTTTLLLQKHNKQFVLSIPVEGMVSLLKKIGSTHGSIHTDKLDDVGAKKIKIEKNLVGINGCAAHLICELDSSIDEEGAECLIVTATIQKALVKPAYWQKTKPSKNINNLFVGSPGAPATLTFLGSGNFGRMNLIVEKK